MKKKYAQIFLSFLLISLFSTSCVYFGSSVKGNGEVEQQKRIIGDFKKVKTSNGLMVYLVPDKEEFIVVEADNNLLNVIETEIAGDELRIYTHERIRWAASKKVFVHYLELEELISRSGTMVYTNGTLHVKSLSTSASSGSQQELDISTSRLKVKCSSGAQIILRGQSTDSGLKASSGAHIRGDELTTKGCRAEVSSGAHIRIRVEESLDGEASSGGHIYYSGNPKQTNISTSSGGQVQRK